MNIYAYHPDDESKTLIPIDKWVVIYHPNTDGRCKICHEPVHVRAEASQKQTHFAHYKNSPCPTVKDNSKPYEVLTTLPRDPTLALEAKAWLRNNIVDVYEKIRSEFTELKLQWVEFHKLIKRANELDIWSLKDMPHEYIPYVLLMCTDKFEKTGSSYSRKQSCFFVLETSPEGIDFWNEIGFYKKEIWEIQLPSRNVINHNIDLSLKKAWYVNISHELLK
jgi:hypothetical protein